MPDFPFTHVVAKNDWNNFHGTFAKKKVALYCTIDALPDTNAGTPHGVRQGQALSAILKYCFDNGEPLRTVGATWSLSNIIEPTNVIIDPSAMDDITRVSDDFYNTYPDIDSPPGNVPIVIGGGTNIGYLNHVLGTVGLALPTSGASDGHLFAGCIATGTHGSAIGFGAVHDMVLAIYLVVAPDKAFLLQPKKAPFSQGLADWFQATSGIPTELKSEDDLFYAAQVHLGSLGFVHSVVIDAVPLYRLRGKMIPLPADDVRVIDAIRTMNTKPIAPGDPYHFSVLVDPYNDPTFYCGFWFQCGVDGVPFADPSPVVPIIPSDLGSFLGGLVGAIDGGIAGPLLEDFLSSKLREANSHPDIDPIFPGQAFPPTNLPPGEGLSTEIVVDQQRAADAVPIIQATLRQQRDQGRHLLGAVSVRFVPKTRALLGMNVNDMNCYIELGSLKTDDIRPIHQACWDALDAAGIPYTCHWGQQHVLDAARVRNWFGDRVDRWKAARDTLLDAKGRLVFSAKTLAQVGL